MSKSHAGVEPSRTIGLSRRQVLRGAAGAAAALAVAGIRPAHAAFGFSPIYAIHQYGNMFYYRHDGLTDGAANWPVQAVQIGRGWDFRHVFAGQWGAIYAIRQNGDLLYFRHGGYATGAAYWPAEAVKIGSGWDFPQVFAGEAGAIYAVTYDGYVLYYHHAGWQTGTAEWSVQGRYTSANLPLELRLQHTVFGGRNGLIYMISPSGTLKVCGRAGRDPTLYGPPLSVDDFGNIWNQYRQVFAGSDGSIYAIRQTGEMMYYRHFAGGWSPTAKQIGAGWDFRHVFASW